MRRPEISAEDAARFDELLEATPEGAEIDPKSPRAWTEGWIYILPGETFQPTPESRELVSRVPVRPRAWLRVEPGDFPFRARTMEHGKGATPLTVARRSALRRHR